MRVISRVSTHFACNLPCGWDSSKSASLNKGSNLKAVSYIKSYEEALESKTREYKRSLHMAAHGKPLIKPPRTRETAWSALASHYKTVTKLQLRQLFADDPKRGERLAVEAVGLYLDYSKNRITDDTLHLLLQLAEESGLRARIDAMFRGEKINITEKRAVLHVALRAPQGTSIVVDGKNVVPEVHAVLDRMADFSNRVRSGEWKGQTGKRIRNVINVGIGGSDLGPVMAYEALKHYSDRTMTFRFVSNIDGTDFAEAVRDLDPSETLRKPSQPWKR
jgi:glucose-6-phosphate isomerase